MNNALKFDGKGYVEVPLNWPASEDGAITIEFWNYVANKDVGNCVAFHFAEDEESPNRILCHAPHKVGKKVYWDYGDIRTGGRLAADYEDYLDKWTHIALVSAGTGQPGFQAIYINGKRVKHQDSSQKPDRPFKQLLIGAGKIKDDVKYHHKGMIDSFRVWNHVRSVPEIKRDMHVELIGDEPGLVACFNFNWGIANTKVSWLKGNPWKTLPNCVKGSPDGDLINFSDGNYVESDVKKTAPIGPVYRLTKDGEEFFTSSYTEKATKEGEGWVADEEPAFHAYRAPAPGTTPLYRLYKTEGSKTKYLITASRTERLQLDPRKHVNDPVAPGNWTYDNEIAYVSKHKSGHGIPLWKSKTSSKTYTTNHDEADDIAKVLYYVIGNEYLTHTPREISFLSNGLSEQLWYVLVCRSHGEKKGVRLKKNQTQVEMADLPTTGDYKAFQWRLEDGRLINRAYSSWVLKISESKIESVMKNNDDNNQRWEFTSVDNKGTDCFMLSQGSNALSCETSGNLSCLKKAATDTKQQWTLLAMDIYDTFTIPGPPASHSGLPFSKYLPAVNVRNNKTTTVHVLGTGTVSDWAMLRVKLIVENMMGALKNSVDVSGLDGVEVIIISQDDSNEELDNSACIGYLHTEGQIQETRGGAHYWLCYVTEEMMWKTGVYNSKQYDDWPRHFDQTVHEFGHMLHYRLAAINENNTPVGPTPEDLADDVKTKVEEVKNHQKTYLKRELYAVSVQSWFNSITKTDSFYYPSTRDELKSIDPDRYNFLAQHFDPENSWMPPIEPRINL